MCTWLNVQRMEEELRSISTVKELLDCVAKAKPNTNVCNKFASDELQILLANAFQVCLCLPPPLIRTT